MENLTTEELAVLGEQEQKMLKFYTEKLPFLRIKAEFDELQASISEALIRKTQADEAYMGYVMKKRDMMDAKKAETVKDPTDASNKD